MFLLIGKKRFDRLVESSKMATEMQSLVIEKNSIIAMKDEAISEMRQIIRKQDAYIDSKRPKRDTKGRFAKKINQQ